MSSFYQINEAFSFLKKETVKKMTVLLPGAGCSYHKTTGGCSMCGFYKETKKYSLGALYPPAVFRHLFLKALKEAQAKNVSELLVFNGGSFWNDMEIPLAFQNQIFRLFSEVKNPSRLLIESRCEYINPEKILSASLALPGKELMVAIGFESRSDYVRNVLIKKSLSLSLFEKKVKLLKDYGISVMAYVFLKPVGLSEKDSLIDVLETIRYLLSLGVDELSLSSAFIQKGTFMHEEYKEGNFRVPWLFTILEIIEEAKKNSWPLFIGNFDDNPHPVVVPHNCEKCSLEIYQAIDDFRRSNKLGKIPSCSCRFIWQQEMQ